MENYGFIYIWYDKKRKMFYIGSHWGTEDDGYICSSNRMRKAYRRRPHDFKRRVIEKVYTDRKHLLEVEYRYLSMIDDSELGNKYYNLTKHLNGHWSAYPENVKTIKEKISHKTKEAMWRDDVREKYLENIKSRDCKSSDPNVRKKRSETMKKTMAEKFPVEERKDFNRPKFGSKEYRDNMASSIAESWKKRDKKKIGSKISESLKSSKEHRSKHISSLKWWNNGIQNKRSKECPGEDWIPGVLTKNKLDKIQLES